MQTFKLIKPITTAVALLIFLLLGVWIMQHSINAYYLQTYHKASPLEKLNNEPLWRFGGAIGNQFYAWRDNLSVHINQSNDNIIHHFNTHYAFDEAYLAKQRQIQEEQRRKAQMAALAKQKDDEKNRQKMRYSLSSGDVIFFAGDSMMQGVAPHLQQTLSKHGVSSVNLSKQSTGLAYPKLFNWQQTIKSTLNANARIKILVIFLGPNDPWDMPDPKTGQILKFGTPEWAAVYQERMADIINSANKHEVAVIWVTPPNMKKASLNEHMITLNTIMQQELSRHNVLTVDARQVLKTTDNLYSDYTDKDGIMVKTRSGDGIHFTPAGQKLVANHIYELLTIQPNE